MPFQGIWLEAPGATLIARVAARKHDASDATQAVVAAQLTSGTGPLSWPRIDARQNRKRVLSQAIALARL